MDALSPGDPERFGDYAIVGRLGVGPRGVIYLGATPMTENYAPSSR